MKAFQIEENNDSINNIPIAMKLENRQGLHTKIEAWGWISEGLGPGIQWTSYSHQIQILLRLWRELGVSQKRFAPSASLSDLTLSCEKNGFKSL